MQPTNNTQTPHPVDEATFQLLKVALEVERLLKDNTISRSEYARLCTMSDILVKSLENANIAGGA